MQVYYLGQLIKVVKAIKYLGLNFAGDRYCPPSVEHLIITAEHTRHAVQNRISNMGGLSPELKHRGHGHLLSPHLGGEVVGQDVPHPLQGALLLEVGDSGLLDGAKLF